jgi:hypothetical protein
LDSSNDELARGSCRVSVSDAIAPRSGSQSGSSVRPTASIFASVDSVEYGGSVKITWKSSGVVSCNIYGPGCDAYGRGSTKCFKETGRSGYVIGNLYETSEFVQECLAPDRKTRISDSVTIDVVSAASEDYYEDDEIPLPEE